MKRILSILLCVLLCCSCLSLTACAVDPYEIAVWYLDSYVDENGDQHRIGYDRIAQTNLYSDDITLQYFSDKTFVLKEFDREYKGTYTYKKRLAKTSVKLTFSDGTKGTGTCGEYMFDGVWYESSLKAFGKEYEFYGGEDGSLSEKDYTPYKGIGSHIYEMLENGWVSRNFDGIYLNKGEIEHRENEYWFIPENEKNTELNLSQAIRLYTYEVLSDFSVERGDNALREGACFINYNSFRVKIGEKEYSETKYEYAVWYYEDVFKTVYPWAAEVEADEILSIDVEWREHHEELYYYTYTWEQYSDKLMSFYTRFVAQKLVEEKELTVAEKVWSYRTDYFIKTAEKTYQVTLETGYVKESDESYYAFVVDGKYYSSFYTERINLYSDGEFYYAFDVANESARLYIDGEFVKSYDDLFGEIIFRNIYTYGGTTDVQYVLKFAELEIEILNEKYFIWYKNGVMRYGEIVGDKDFSEIFSDYPKE